MVINCLFFDMWVKSKFKLLELRCPRPINFPLSKSYTYSYVIPLRINSSSQMFIIAYHDEVINHISEKKNSTLFYWNIQIRTWKRKTLWYDLGGQGFVSQLPLENFQFLAFEKLAIQ